MRRRQNGGRAAWSVAGEGSGGGGAPQQGGGTVASRGEEGEVWGAERKGVRQREEEERSVGPGEG